MSGWALITGASSGIGTALARIAAAQGHDLILTARSTDRLDRLAEELRASGVQVLCFPADLNRLDEVEQLWRDATAEGRRIGVLVNNAGLGQHGRYRNAANWAQELVSINVNMLALARLMKLALPHMQDAGGGRILNVASTAAFLPGPNLAVYHASKSFVLSLSESVAEEMAGKGVSVTALCPGPTATNFFNAADMDGVTLTKLFRPAPVDDVARAGWHGMLRGKRIVVPGVMNKLSAFLPRLAPRRLVSWMMRAVWAK